MLQGVDTKAVAFASVEAMLNGLAYTYRYSLSRSVVYPNEIVYYFRVVFEYPTTASYAFFDVAVFVSAAGRLVKTVVVDSKGHEYPSFTDDLVYSYFDKRDNRRNYFRNWFFTSIRK